VAPWLRGWMEETPQAVILWRSQRLRLAPHIR
jgi:hypothetical protein